MFDTLTMEGFAKTLGLFVLVVSTGLAWLLALLMRGNWQGGFGVSLVQWVMIGFALALSATAVLGICRRVTGRVRRHFHRPVPVRVDLDGVHQTGTAENADVDLKWEDIRLIQHKGTTHTVRGTDKSQKIEISKQLEGHRTLSSFLKFSFLLRQEIGENWRDLLTEVKARLEGPGFHFHYDRDRTNSVFINNVGIRHTSADGVESEMSWDLMRGSIMDVQDDQLRFRHTGSKTSLTIPRGIDSDDVVEELIRWALHTAPDFSHT